MRGTYEQKDSDYDYDAENDIVINGQPFEDNRSYDNAQKYAIPREDQMYVISERNESSEVTCTVFNA